MSLLQLFAFRPLVDRTDDMAQRVASRSRLAVWQRVKDGLAELDAAEARGYIRARALAVVKEETSRLIEQEGSKVARQRERIESLSAQSLVTTIVDQYAARPATALARRAA
jgi:hypothetical protein